MSTPPVSRAPAAPVSIPPQIRYIIGNEGCERFSFYGMRNILTVFLVTSLLSSLPQAERAGEAKHIFHTFVIGVYFFPLLGGWLADRYWGKYRVILWLSLLYCVGQFCLALYVDRPAGFYTGLFLIALGSGGIKPCVSSFVGDQFDQSNKGRAKVVFDAFYWIINFGSFFASLLMPIFLHQLGPAVAFGVPGVLMAVSTVVLWAGRKRYVMVPSSPPDPHSFLQVARDALSSGPTGWGFSTLAALGALASFALLPGFGFVVAACTALVAVLAFGGLGVWRQLDTVRDRHPTEAIVGVRGVLRVLVFFALVTPFWSLFDQKASTWVLQADAMSKPSWFQSSQMQALNPALVMILIPLNNLFLFPLLRRLGYEMTALRRMTLGIALSGLAWVVVACMQLVLDGGRTFPITWQILPYAILTLGEVLVSATGLEFAYSQAPQAMKGVLMSFWQLAVTVGNLWVLIVNAGVKDPSVTNLIATTGFGVTAFQMFFFAAFAFAAAAIFGLVARSYREADHYRST